MKRFIISLIITLILGSGILFLINYHNNSSSDESEINYIFDISYFEEVEINDLEELINNEETILLIGEKSQNTTAKMSTYLKEIVRDYNLKIYYLEKEDIDVDAYNNWVNTIDNLNTYSGFTPVLLVFKNNLLIGGYPGDAEYRNLYSFLSYCEIKGVVLDE